MEERLTQGKRAWGIGVGINVILALVKLTGGIMGQSQALIADAVESLGDLFSSVIVWGGLVIGDRPADEDHPYGHGKAEPLAGLAVALSLGIAAIWIGLRSVQHIVTPQESPAAYTLLIVLGVVVAKEWMYRFELRVGKRIDSTVIVADAWHHRSDALTSAAAAIGITVALLGGPAYASADAWAALVACAVILFNGVGLARSAASELMDTTPDTDLSERIREATLEIGGARCVEKAVVRKMGPHLYVDLHLEVDPGLTVRKAHAIAHEVKDMIMARWPAVADVLVHIEPYRGGTGAG